MSVPVQRRAADAGRPPNVYEIFYSGELVGMTRRGFDGYWTARVQSARVLSEALPVQGLRSRPFRRHADATDWLVAVHRNPTAYAPAGPLDELTGSVVAARQSRPQVRCSACKELLMTGFDFDWHGHKDDPSPCCGGALERVL